MGLNAQSVIAELDTALGKASKSKHAWMLCSIVDLFLRGAESFSNDQIAIFGDVIGRLIENLERAELAELSTKLAPIAKAPQGVIERLASHDDIAVSGPVLAASAVLTDEILAGLAKTKGQFHLGAIAARSRLGESVTDHLIDRGNLDVARKLLGNPEARLSELGFVKLIKRSESEGELATLIANRDDIPRELRPFLKTPAGSPSS
ncbi:MAG TPA: DUF2336 domain-containing protein [Xanthobacteraceae bacterium]|nr:DUF2336 domain-containing protein [Xanthobacteraceae bacterium]